ncbi:hypothetical protein KI387_010930, partial [Taxus chinensis]
RARAECRESYSSFRGATLPGPWWGGRVHCRMLRCSSHRRSTSASGGVCG